MKKHQIRDHIEKSKFQLAELAEFWQGFQDQNKHLNVDSTAFQTVQVKVSGKMAYLQKSINDQEELLLKQEI